MTATWTRNTTLHSKLHVKHAGLAWTWMYKYYEFYHFPKLSNYMCEIYSSKGILNYKTTCMKYIVYIFHTCYVHLNSLTATSYIVTMYSHVRLVNGMCGVLLCTLYWCFTVHYRRTLKLCTSASHCIITHCLWRCNGPRHLLSTAYTCFEQACMARGF